MGVWWHTYNRDMGIVSFPSFFFFSLWNTSTTKLSTYKATPCVGQCQSVGSRRFVSNKGYVFLPSLFCGLVKGPERAEAEFFITPFIWTKAFPDRYYFSSKEKISLRNRDDDDGWSSGGAKLCRGKSLETYGVSLTYDPESRDSVLSPS